MEHFNSFRKAEHVAMAGLTLTVCGTALMLMHGQASADTTTQTSQEIIVNPHDQTTQQSVAEQQSFNPVASQSYQNVPVAVQAYDNHVAPTTVSRSTNISTAQAGWLDNANYSSKNLHVSGWHAADQSVNQPNHFLIVYDQTAHQQLTVKNITNQEISRPDVQTAHRDINNANKSGFSADFTIDSPAYLNHQLMLVSRYSDIADGNGDNGHNAKTDKWFTLPRADQGNEAWLDTVTIGGVRYTYLVGTLLTLL